MAIPSGTGTEVFKTAVIDNQSGGATTIFTVPALHIYTVLSVSCHSKYGSNATYVNALNMYVTYSSVDYSFLNDQHVPYKGTYVWSERFVMGAGGALKFSCNQNMDIYCSYLDQDWT